MQRGICVLLTCMLKCVINVRRCITHIKTGRNTHTCMYVENRGVCLTAVPWEAAVF